MAQISTVCPPKFTAIHNFSCAHNLLKANYNNFIKEVNSKSSHQKADECTRNSTELIEKTVKPLFSKNFEPEDVLVSNKIDDNQSKFSDDFQPEIHEKVHSEVPQPTPFIICFPENNFYKPDSNTAKISQPPNTTQIAPPLPPQPLQLPQPPKSSPNTDCINNFFPMAKKRTRTPFTKEEDNKLKELVQLYSCIEDKSKWYFIANQIPDRSARQCRERFQLFLCDGIRRKEKWTKEEDDLLLSKYAIIGPHWKSMEKFFVGRTSYAIKNRYISLNRQKKHFNSGSSDENSNDYSSNDISTNSDIKNIAINIGSLVNTK